MSGRSSPTTPPLPPPTQQPIPSSSSTSQQPLTPLAQEVQSLVTQIRDAPKDSAPFSKLIPAALQFVNEEAGGNKKHLFCSQDGRQPDRHLQACMLRVLSFKPGPEIKEWLDMLGKCLHSCSRCYKNYLEAKHTILPMYLAGFSDAQIERFLSFIDEWEEGVARDLLKSRNVTAGQGLGSFSPSELYAILSIAALRPQIRETIIDTLTLHKLSFNLRESNPGILCLAFHESEKARRWAHMQVFEQPRTTPIEARICATRPVQKAIQQLHTELSASPSPQRAQQLWQAVRIVASCAPDALSILTPVISSHLSDPSECIGDILFAFDRLLRLKSPRIWDEYAKEDGEYPLVLLSNILDNQGFIQAISKATERDVGDCTDWMTSLLGCLQEDTALPDETPVAGGSSSGVSTPRRQDTPPIAFSAQYGQVLKRLVHLLLERLQHGHVASRKLLLDQGLTILTQAFTSISDLASPQFQTISEVIGLYARPLTAFAFRGSAPNSADKVDAKDPSRVKAKELVLLMFEADQAIVADSIRHLSEITQSHLYKWRQRKKPGQPTSDEIYALAAKETYPSPSISTELWSNAYQSFNPSGNLAEAADGASVFLKPISKLILFGEPTINTHLLPIGFKGEEPKTYADYKHSVKSSIVSISRRLRAMRGELPMLLGELAEADTTTNQSHLREQCVLLSEELMLLNLSSVPELHKAAQSIVRAAYSEVESRADVFKALLSGSTTSIRGLEFSLDLFVKTCNELVEANDAAKWMVRSGADILDVFCNRTGGLLRPGAEGSLVDRDDATRRALEDLLPSVWELMSKSVAVIFQKTPKWSEHIAKEDMVAWFRDVTIFASQLTEQVELVAKAANARRRSERKAGTMASEEEEEVYEYMVSCLALPLEQAMSWLRINDVEIVGETMTYIVQALDCFKKNAELPQRVADKMLKFIKEQVDIENAQERKTLLSTSELIDLQARLDPTVSQAIVISDDEAADVDIKPTQQPSSSWLASMTSPTKGAAEDAAQKERKRKLKQQKLSFTRKDVIDVDNDQPAKYAQSWSVPTRTPAAPAPAANKYRSATTAAKAAPTAAAAKRSVPARPTNANMAALRKDFASTRSFVPAPTNVNRRPPVRAPGAQDMREPRAPLAVSSITGAAASAPHRQQQQQTRKGGAGADSDSSSDSDGDDDDDDEQAGPKGIAALAAAKRSAHRVGGQAPIVSAPQPRRTKLLDDGAIEKARRDRQEAERKRMLRQPVELQPLLQSILGWNWYHEGDAPPAGRGSSGPDYRPVPSRFDNQDHYGSVFGPLLMLETWSQFCQAKEEFGRGAIPMYSCEVQGRVSVDAFIDISATMTSMTPASFRLGDMDVVLMRQRSGGFDAGPGATRPPRPRMFLAKVEAFKSHKGGSNFTLRCMLENDDQGVTSQLVNRSIWDIGSLFNLNTVAREFAALLTAQYYDLSRQIFSAKVAQRQRLEPQRLDIVRKQYGVNLPQAEAIVGALGTDGFSLIQGPPGTGKTKTICAMIAHFVATRKTPANITTGGRTAAQTVPKKLLLCAPSNAAIDEVARRAKLGVKTPDGNHIKINVVRIGRDDVINVAARDISLDRLMEDAMAKSAGEGGLGSGDASVDQLVAEVRSLRDERERKQAELEDVRKTGNAARVQHLEVEIRTLTSKRMTVSQKLDEARDKRQTAFRQREADRKRLRQEILLGADVICSTLSGAGHEALASLPIDFETVIIDEAAQAVELSTLVPLRYGAKRCIMVGDPNQLPPTVISPKAEKLRYSQSLFVRLFEQAKQNVYLLSIQYRMHPDISQHPSATFYGGALKDGPDMARLTAQPWHSDSLLKPFRFFSVRGQERASRGHSFANTDEASAAVSIYDRLRRAAPSVNFDGRIGCVTGYKGQVQELKRVFQARYGSDIDQRIDFNTVDGFQGQEKDIIIMSCVRSGERGLGFLTDARRINVAVTRAKSNLFIIGNAEGLRRASGEKGLWRLLVDQAESRGALQAVERGTFSGPVGDRSGGSNGNSRPRPAGWTKMDENVGASTQSPPRSSGGGGYGGVKRFSDGGDSLGEPASKKARPSGQPDSSASASASAASSPARPPLPAGLQTMRPTDAASPRPAPAAGPARLPAGLQTRRPGDVPGPGPGAPSRPPISHHPHRPPGAPPHGAQPSSDRLPPQRPRPGPPPGAPGARVFHPGKSGGGGSGGANNGLVRPQQNGQGRAGPDGAPPRPPHVRPPPRPMPARPSNNGPSVPSAAAMDAVFVKKRKK